LYDEAKVRELEELMQKRAAVPGLVRGHQGDEM